MKRYIQKSGIAFEFSSKNLEKLQHHIAQYPQGREQSAVIAALDLGQRQNQGWISQEVLQAVARYLEMPEIRVYEIATFYSMFNLSPVGKYHVQVCTTTPCWLRGSDDILKTCQQQKQKHGKEIFTVIEVECLGACANSPMIQINDDYYEDLNVDTTTTLLEKLAQDQKVAIGSQQARCGSAPMTPSQDLPQKDGTPDAQ